MTKGRARHLWATVPVLLAPLLAFGQNSGHIQVKCDPGVKIFLDGQFKGETTSDLGGLIIQNIAAGNHKIRAVCEGFEPQEDSLSVEAGQVLVYQVRPFKPKPKITEEGKEGGAAIVAKVGTIVIQSLPVECTIDIPSVGVETAKKQKDVWKIENVPAGNHQIRMEALGKTLEFKADVASGGTVRLMADFVDGKVVETIEGPKTVDFVDIAGGLRLELVKIPAGEFQMGSPFDEMDRGGHEGPVHHVRIEKPFWIGKYEVTQEQWQAIMGSNPSNFQGSLKPVEQVSWNNCQEFLRKLNAQVPGGGFRLPTEAEWEYACRAGTQTRFSFGDDPEYESLVDYAWYQKNSGGTTHPVGGLKPNAWGLYDMHGNVWEWTSSLLKPYPYAAGDGRETPQSVDARVLRGGSFTPFPRDCRSAHRCGHGQGFGYAYVGFRLARTIP